MLNLFSIIFKFISFFGILTKFAIFHIIYKMRTYHTPNPVGLKCNMCTHVKFYITYDHLTLSDYRIRKFTNFFYILRIKSIHIHYDSLYIILHICSHRVTLRNKNIYLIFCK